MIVNESDGTKQVDEKWTDIIDGMRILFTQEQLTQYLQDGLFPDRRHIQAQNNIGFVS